MEDKSYFNKVCFNRFLLALTPFSSDKSVSSSWYWEGTFHMEILSPTSRKKKEGQMAFLASALSWVPLTQNNQYTNVAYLG